MTKTGEIPPMDRSGGFDSRLPAALEPAGCADPSVRRHRLGDGNLHPCWESAGTLADSQGMGPSDLPAGPGAGGGDWSLDPGSAIRQPVPSEIVYVK